MCKKPSESEHQSIITTTKGIWRTHLKVMVGFNVIYRGRIPQLFWQLLFLYIRTSSMWLRVMETAFWRGREDGDHSGERLGREYEAPRQIPRRTIYSYGWIHCRSQISTPVSVCVRAEDAGMLSDSREHLSCLEFSFLVPTRVLAGEGAFLWSLQG